VLWQWQERGGGRALGRGVGSERGRMGGERGGEMDRMEDSRGGRGGVGCKWQKAH